MLRERLKPYFDTLEPHEKPQAIRAVAHLILIGDYMAYRKLIKDFNIRGYELFYKEVRDLVRSSFECRKIWRTVFATLQEPDFKLAEAAEKFGADPRDISFLWKRMTKEDKRQVRDIAAKHEDGFDYLSREQLAELTKKLEKHCAKVAWLKLQFLSNNDRIFDLDDLKFELLTHAIQVVRLYEHCGDMPKILNYAKAGVSNHAINLIQFHTSESRARIANATKGCGTCVFCVTDKPQKCKHAVADYRSTTLSLQGLAPNSDALPQPSLRCAPAADKRVQRDSFVSFMKKDMPDSASKIIDLVVKSDPDEEFEQWLWAVHQKTVDKLLNNPRRLVRLLCEYLDVSHKDMTNSIRERYDEYRSTV